MILIIKNLYETIRKEIHELQLPPPYAPPHLAIPDTKLLKTSFNIKENSVYISFDTSYKLDNFTYKSSYLYDIEKEICEHYSSEKIDSPRQQTHPLLYKLTKQIKENEKRFEKKIKSSALCKKK